MSELIQTQINNARNEIAIWNNFLNAVSQQSDEIVKAQGEINRQMVWRESKVDYYVDPVSYSPIDRSLIANADNFINLRFSIPNYNVRQGTDSCKIKIGIEIENLERTIEALQQNL